MAFSFAGQWGPEPAIDRFGNAVYSATFRVLTTAGDEATVYTDRTRSTTASQPLDVDGEGNATFYAEPGRYTLELSAGGSVTSFPVGVTPDAEDVLDEATANAAFARLLKNSLYARDYGAIGAGAAIQAAHDALPAEGGVIWLDDGSWDMGAGLAFSKLVILASIGRTERRYGGNCVITSSIAPQDYITLNVGAALNAYGYQFHGIKFDMTKPTRSAIYAENCNHVVVEDCAFAIGVGGAYRNVYGIHSATLSAVAGYDSSWWRVTDCRWDRCGFIKTTAPANQQPNQWVVKDNAGYLGDDMAAPSIHSDRGARWVVRDNNFERGYDAQQPACHFIEHIGMHFAGNEGEWLWRLSKQEDCRDSVFIAGGGGGSYGTHFEDIRGRDNVYISANRRTIITNPVGAIHALGGRGASPSTLLPDSWMPIRSNVATSIFGREVPPDAIDIMPAKGLTIEYHDGTSWVAFAAANQHDLFNAPGAVTLDATTKRMRVRNTDPLGTKSAGVLLVKCLFSSITTMTLRVQYLDAAFAVLSEQAYTVPNLASTPGALIATRQGAEHVRVEFDTPLSGAQTGVVDRVSLFVPSDRVTAGSGRQHGRQSYSRGTPEGVVTGNIGDRCTDLTNGNVYSKQSGTGNVGWRQLAFVP